MRIAARPETAAEAAALALNLFPLPAVQALYAPAIGRVLHVAARTGLLARLAGEPAGAQDLAEALGLRPEGTRHLLECLGALGHAREEGGRWRLTRRARAWLDPASPRSVHGYVDHAHDYWAWWAGLEALVREGRSVDIHDAPPGDPGWDRYVRGQYELARLSAPEVARALRLPGRPEALLDVGGAHGWFAAELCRRHPGLRATVIDLPGAVEAGREIVAEAGMAGAVAHVAGDARTAPLGGPYDVALIFNFIHHLGPEEVRALLRRVHAALRPGGTLAVLDLFARPAEAEPDSAAFLGLFFHLTSGAATYAPGQLEGWLAEAGFGSPRRVGLRRLPAQTLFEARRG